MTSSIQKYLDGAVRVLENLGIKPNPQESQLVDLLDTVKHVDEAKVTAVAKTIRYMHAFNELVRENVGDMRVGDRYNDITKNFDTIIEDAKGLVGQLDDGRIDWKERIGNFWMKVTRGSTHHRFEEIRTDYLAVARDTNDQLKSEETILDAYIDFRFAMKDAEALSFDVLKAQETLLKTAEEAYQTKSGAVVEYQKKTEKDAAELSRLQLARDEAKRAYDNEDRNYQLIKDVAENLSQGYNIGDVLMAKLSQTHSLKGQVYRRAIAFFNTNEHVFTTLDALFTSQHGLHEQTQTIEAMKSGAEKSIEAVADLGKNLEKAAIKAGYGATIGASFVQKLIDSVVAFQTESYGLIAEARKEATNNAELIKNNTEAARQQLATVVTKYLPAAQ